MYTNFIVKIVRYFTTGLDINMYIKNLNIPNKNIELGNQWEKKQYMGSEIWGTKHEEATANGILDNISRSKLLIWLSNK